MLKKTITYTDYNGVERTEDFYFNLSKTEIIKMQAAVPGGFADYIEKIIASKDNHSLTKVFMDLILRAYGEKSPDGKRFVKSDELSEAFSQTEAFDVLFTEFIDKPDAITEFVNAIIPAGSKKN